MATSPQAIPVRIRTRTLRQMVIATDSEFMEESENVREYEFSKRKFRGRYKVRGPYEPE